MPKPWLLYDTEIREIPYTGGEKEEGLIYCDGWRDYSNMTITVICTYSWLTDEYGIFMQDNLYEFQQLVYQHEQIMGFNSIGFDDHVCKANGIDVTTTYDILCEFYRAAGLNAHPDWKMLKLRKDDGDEEAEILLSKYKGYRLEDICQANFGVGKSGNGQNAAKLWQQGKYGQIVNYCLRDVWLTKLLVDKRDCLISPVDRGVELYLREPA